jgi:hypothetical protein
MRPMPNKARSNGAREPCGRKGQKGPGALESGLGRHGARHVWWNGGPFPVEPVAWAEGSWR